MVLGQSDFAAACQHVEQLCEELALDRRPRLGAMIETPAALFALQDLLQQADFVSIGTNDLTQYMLAADRDAAELVDDYSVLHPSVLRAIYRVVKACDRAGCELSVCGEAAGETSTASILIGMGVRQLSMSPIRAARVRLGIRHLVASELTELAQQALQSDSVAAVRELLDQFQSTKQPLALG
jgi:phosphoenolpyruvate-protein kinase (PTS system EI component)